MKRYIKSNEDYYFGKEEYEKYHERVSQKLAGQVISKRVDDAEEPGGIEYEANRLGLPDLFDLLRCLEGMCYHGEAREISDYQYEVL